MGVRHSAKTARILAANVLPRSNVITSMGAVSPAVTGDIKESSAPKVVHLQTKSNAPRVVHLHLHIYPFAECDWGYHGYNCNETCQSCSSTGNGSCNAVTGLCPLVQQVYLSFYR